MSLSIRNIKQEMRNVTFLGENAAFSVKAHDYNYTILYNIKATDTFITGNSATVVIELLKLVVIHILKMIIIRVQKLHIRLMVATFSHDCGFRVKGEKHWKIQNYFTHWRNN